MGETFTRRVRIDFEYLGGNYAGWQWQDNALSIQQVVETALAKIVGHPVRFNASGRTDAGVNAFRQPTHVDINSTIGDEELLRGMNSLLPVDISAISVTTVDSRWHCRFDSKEKTYQYDVLNRRGRSVFLHGRAWHVRKPLNIEVMRNSACLLLGEHDFSSFRSAGCSAKHPVRTLTKAEIEVDGDMIHFTFTADGFLKQMVRNMVGTIVDMGKGKIAPDKMEEILNAKDRTKAGTCAPAEGLYLVDVVY